LKSFAAALNADLSNFDDVPSPLRSGCSMVSCAHSASLAAEATPAPTAGASTIVPPTVIADATKIRNVRMSCPSSDSACLGREA
jgi:hypothetical protein